MFSPTRSGRYDGHLQGEFQPVYHTVYTSPTRRIKTRHFTAPDITSHGTPKVLIITHFNYIYITYIILT
jgi:hypothetical protein